MTLPADGRLLKTAQAVPQEHIVQKMQSVQSVQSVQSPSSSWSNMPAPPPELANLAAVASASFNEASRVAPSTPADLISIPLSQDPPMLRSLSPSWTGEDNETGDAPSPEEVPPWRPSKVMCEAPSLVEPPLVDTELPESPREICWTPSFKSLVVWPSREESIELQVVDQGAHVEQPTERPPELPDQPEAPEIDEKPSRVSMAPTVHDAVCEDGFESEDEEDENDEKDEKEEEEEDRDAETEDAEQAQESQASESTDVNEAALRGEISDLRAALENERAEKDELRTLLRQTEERLSSCEGHLAQMEQELNKSRAERDALRRRLQETAEQHVELTKRLRNSSLISVLLDGCAESIRKQQELSKSLDKDLNKAEEKRRELQNKFEQFRLEMDQAQTGLSELDSSGSVRDSPEAPEALPQALLDEEELPTAGGLLREWANVYQDPSESLERLQKPAPGPPLQGLTGPPLQGLTAPPLQGMGGPLGPLSGACWDVEALPVPSKVEGGQSTQGQPASTGGLSMRDLSEIKALKKPPPPVRMLMEVCCVLFNIEPVKSFDERARKRIDYWEPARRYLLSDPFLLSKLRAKLDIEPAQRAKIQKYFKDPNFSSERILKCSKAAYELYACVSALAKGPRASQEL
eukprot:Skav227418  [mRNA]  locus=scaffold950:181956:184462:- [translate_table: standard]